MKNFKVDGHKIWAEHDGNGWVRVLLDGKELHHVKSFNVDAGMELTKVTITMYVDSVQIVDKGNYKIPGEDQE